MTSVTIDPDRTALLWQQKVGKFTHNTVLQQMKVERHWLVLALFNDKKLVGKPLCREDSVTSIRWYSCASGQFTCTTSVVTAVRP